MANRYRIIVIVPEVVVPGDPGNHGDTKSEGCNGTLQLIQVPLHVSGGTQ